MKRIMLISVLLYYGLLLNAQKSHEEIIQNYFQAFNQGNYAAFSDLITDDFTMQEGDIAICNNRTEFKNIFKWDSVFVPKFDVKDIEVLEEKCDVIVSKIDKRIKYLHDAPMVSKLRINFLNNKISKLTILDYEAFDLDKWQGRLKEINTWINKNHPELNGFSRDLTPQGAKNYLKAIELFSNRELTKDEKIFIDKDLQLVHLKDSVFVHISWHKSKKWGRFSSNGLIVAKDGEAIMIDTPMDNETTARLYNYLNNKMRIKVIQFIAGHFHDDCMGGIGFLHSKGVKSLVCDLTMQKCKKDNLPLPTNSFKESQKLNFNGKKVQAHYYGGGHSFDNIVVWLPQDEILFGGCLIKNTSAKGMGNLSDAVVEDWDKTVIKIQKAYPSVSTVIPGHGNYGGAELLSHTIELVKNYKNSNK